MSEMWEERTALMLESLEGSGVSLDSESLLDDVIEAGNRHAKVKLFLDSLPGYPTDAAVALKQLEYLVAAARGARRMAAGDRE